MKRALILTVRKSLEYDFTTIYRWAFLGEVADAIVKTGLWDIDIFDGGVLNAFFDDYLAYIKNEYDLILFYTDPHTAKEVKIICEYIKTINPQTKILVYGRATFFIPQFFERWPFDAVHISGDRELIISDYALFLAGKLRENDITGLSIVKNNKIIRFPEGRRLDKPNWYFPLLNKLPIEEYKKIYEKKNRVFEYSISVSKGCPYNCLYCEASSDQGLVDRRRNPSEVIHWINTQILDSNWHIQLWSSNFFLDQNWVLDFCSLYTKEKSNFLWRCVGNFRNINPEIIAKLGNSGCYEIAVGVETLNEKTKKSPKGSMAKLLNLIKVGKENNVNIKCLLMAGIPGQSVEDIRYTIKILNDVDASFRYSLFTPLYNLKNKSIDELDKTDLSIYDRRTYISSQSNIDKDDLIMILAKKWEKFIL